MARATRYAEQRDASHYGKGAVSSRTEDQASDPECATEPLRRTRRFKSAFSVSAEDLVRLSELLKPFGTDLWNVEISDGTVMQHLSLDQILALPNGTCSVRKTTVMAVPVSDVQWHRPITVVPRVSAEAKVELDADPDGFYTCRVEASGDRVLVDAFFKQVNDWLHDVTPRYSLFAKPVLPFVLPLMAIPLIGRLFGVGAAISRSFHIGSYLSASLEALAILGISLGSPFLLEHCQAFLFPRGEFAFGYGTKRQQFRSAVRWCVLIALIVGVVASVIANIISDQLGS